MHGEQGSRANSQRGSLLGSRQASLQAEPYRLRAVGHSLGGACLLIYAVTRAMKGEPTHISRLILLTPAGFQQKHPRVCVVVALPALHTDMCLSQRLRLALMSPAMTGHQHSRSFFSNSVMSPELCELHLTVQVLPQRR